VASGWKALSASDPVIAATAERHGATAVHHDGDCDKITGVTGRPTRRVVPPGTAD
jgi:predicted nucleic acid-binding protein